LSLLFGFCAACMLSYRCLQMEWWAAVTVVPADCILPILVRKLAVGVFPATAIPNRLLRFHGFFFGHLTMVRAMRFYTFLPRSSADPPTMIILSPR